MPGGDDARTDAELIDAINRGDDRAFEALYLRHRDWVARLAYRYTGDRDLALDALQEVFAYLVRKAPRLRLTAKMTTFLYPVVRHTAQAIRRKHARGSPLGDEALADLAAPQPAGDGADDLAAILAGLSSEHREVVLMRFVDGFSLAEVAEALAIPLGTVKSRLHHALYQLRDDPAAQQFFQDP